MTPEQAQALIDAWDIDVMLDDEEEVTLLERHNPELLDAYRSLREIAQS